MKSPAELWAESTGRVWRWADLYRAQHEAWKGAVQTVNKPMFFWLGAEADKEAA